MDFKQSVTDIIIGSDHAAFDMKNCIKDYLTKLNITVEDVGAYNTESVDYPVYAKKVAQLVSSGTYEKGILLCGTGIGMSLVANRFKNIRAALCNDLFSAKMSRVHNDSNILVMGARVIGDVLAKEIVSVWLQTSFEGGRHQNRLNLFNALGETV